MAKKPNKFVPLKQYCMIFEVLTGIESVFTAEHLAKKTFLKSLPIPISPLPQPPRA